MSFQSYLDNIAAKTGKTPDDFKAMAQAEGLAVEGGLAPGVKPAAVIAWLSREFALGHGHAMAIVALLKGKTR